MVEITLSEIITAITVNVNVMIFKRFHLISRLKLASRQQRDYNNDTTTTDSESRLLKSQLMLSSYFKGHIY